MISILKLVSLSTPFSYVAGTAAPLVETHSVTGRIDIYLAVGRIDTYQVVGSIFQIYGE